MRARAQGGGHPQGVPLRLDYVGRAHGGEGTHKGCPYGWIMWARTRGEGTHKGCPYGWIWGRAHGGEGAHRGCPYGWMPLWGRVHGGRAPTRGAPTRFRQPHVVLSQFDAIALGICYLRL